MPIDELVMLAEDLNSDRVWDLRPAMIEWQALGATEGCFEGYRLDFYAIEAVEAVEAAAGEVGTDPASKV